MVGILLAAFLLLGLLAHAQAQHLTLRLQRDVLLRHACETKFVAGESAR